MEIEQFISIERLSTYLKHTDRKKNAIALHNHTLQLGTSIMSMIALLELSLRNITNLRIIEDFGDSEWLLPNHAALPLKTFEVRAISKAYSQAQKVAYSELDYREKSELNVKIYPDGIPRGVPHSTVAKKRQALFEPSHGQVIAQTTLAFWKRLYSREYDHLLWKPSLKKIFPNKSIMRSEVSRSLEATYVARNRVAHHEPIYGERLEDTIDAIEFIRESIGSRKGDDDSSFKKFSNVHYLRLHMDYAAFQEAWNTLT